MTASDDLFQLVKTMNKNEKRYCRLFLKQRIGKEAGGCLALFDEIAVQKRYDEGALRAKFSTARSTSQFPMMKSYLYTLLLKGLNAYRADRSDRQQLRDLLEHADLLVGRGLYSQARKMLRKARKIATRKEFLPEMLMIIDIEYWIDRQVKFAGQQEASLDERNMEATEILKKLENYQEYLDLYHHLYYSLNQSGPQATSATRERLDAIMAHPRLRSIEEATSLLSKCYYFASHLVYCVHIGDDEEGYRISAQYHELLESDRITHQTISSLLHVHFYQFNFFILLNRRFEAYRTYQRICASVTSSDPLYYRVWKEMTGVAMHIMLFDFAKLIERAPSIERFFDNHADEIDHHTRHAFMLSLAFAHLMLENHAAAAEVLHRLVNDARGEIRIDTLIEGRLLQMIAHYELGNIEVLPYLWRSAYYLIRKHDRLFPYEMAMLQFLRELPDVKTEGELIPKLEWLKGKLMEEDCDVSLELVPWLESKIERRPLRDIVEERRLTYAGEIVGE